MSCHVVSLKPEFMDKKRAVSAMVIIEDFIANGV
jgi:hypothetical protein